MTEDQVLNKTWSICPVCRKRIPAERIRRGNEVYQRKNCDGHGTFETIIWRGFSDFIQWAGEAADPDNANSNCPDDCGLCSSHLQNTCCVILNVTGRCNLNCRFCFADPSFSGNDPSLDEIRNSMKDCITPGKTFLQLSGGEPTLRDDLPEIVRIAKESGAKYVQLNSNGLRLANDKQFVRDLAAAGLSFVFMQFDGTEDSIYRKLRNRPLLETKKKAIETCAEFNIGVTLVPTLVKGVNTDDIGEMIRFAISQTPTIRGIHFQPAAYLGRIPELPVNDDRFTLDELIHEIQSQSNGIVNAENLLPSCCDHPLCGFHGDFIIYNGQLNPLLKRKEQSAPCCCDPDAAEKNREFIGRRWKRPETSEEKSEKERKDLQDMEFFLRQVNTHGFTLTSMAFQDAGNIDLARLRRCSLHVYDKGRMVPFCSYYLSPWNRVSD